MHSYPMPIEILATEAADGTRDSHKWVGITNAASRVQLAGCDAHAIHVSWISSRLSEFMGLGAAEARIIGAAGKLHDIGKRFLPCDLLEKADALSAQEWRSIRDHPRLGALMLSGIASELGVNLSTSIEAAWYHHERWDGSGYPLRLAGKDIPLVARIVAIADVFDALTAARPYKVSWPRTMVTAYISDRAGTLFDPQCAAAFANFERVMPLDWQRMAQLDEIGRSPPQPPRLHL